MLRSPWQFEILRTHRLEIKLDVATHAGVITSIKSYGRALETSDELKAHALTGNREMAEDLDRVTCKVCGRAFAPSVHVRHVPICEARAAKEKAKAEAKLEASKRTSIAAHAAADAAPLDEMRHALLSAQDDLASKAEEANGLARKVQRLEAALSQIM